MTDFGNQQFYEVRGPEDQPPTTPHFNKQKLLQVLLIIFGVIITTTLIFLLFSFIQNRSVSNNAEKATINNIANKVARMVDDCSEENKDWCQNKYWTDEAISANNIDFCKNVGDDWIRSCVTQIAVNLEDTILCKTLDEDMQVECSDAVLLSSGFANNNLDYCEKIFNNDKKQSCVNQIVKELVKNNNCPESGFGVEECIAEALLQSKIDSGRCEDYAVDTIGYESCMDTVIDSDKDGDGISYFDEVNVYGTDPNNFDSDGDGYDDGTEISRGFDPLN